jgi:hypothetical protein
MELHAPATRGSSPGQRHVLIGGENEQHLETWFPGPSAVALSGPFWAVTDDAWLTSFLFWAQWRVSLGPGSSILGKRHTAASGSKPHYREARLD